MLWNCAAVPEGFAVGCEDSEDTGFCPLRIMWCAPEQPRVLESAKQAASETFSFALLLIAATLFLPFSVDCR